MTDTLSRAPVAPALQGDGVDDDLGCGCCTRPPTAVADQVAQLEARREALERRLQGLGRDT